MLNKSYSYLLPLFNEKCKLNHEYFIMLKNIYTRYNDNLEYFVLCYEYGDHEKFLEYLNELRNNNLFEEEYKIDDLLYLVFKFPKEYLSEYYYYKNGQFSKFSDRAKLIILEYVFTYHKNSSGNNIREILYKEKSLKERLESQLNLNLSKDVELSSIPNLKLETCYK